MNCPKCQRQRNRGHHCNGRDMRHEIAAFEQKARAEMAKGVKHVTDPEELRKIQAEIEASRSPFRSPDTAPKLYADRRRAGGWRRRS